MSTLHDFVYHQLDNKPNDTHNIPDPQPRSEDAGHLPAHAKRLMEAQKKGSLRPALFYSQQEQVPCPDGVWESPRTVRHKLESKEEFPLG